MANRGNFDRNLCRLSTQFLANQNSQNIAAILFLTHLYHAIFGIRSRCQVSGCYPASLPHCGAVPTPPCTPSTTHPLENYTHQIPLCSSQSIPGCMAPSTQLYSTSQTTTRQTTSSPACRMAPLASISNGARISARANQRTASPSCSLQQQTP
jgi:hypothetical protein